MVLFYDTRSLNKDHVIAYIGPILCISSLKWTIAIAETAFVNDVFTCQNVLISPKVHWKTQKNSGEDPRTPHNKGGGHPLLKPPPAPYGSCANAHDPRRVPRLYQATFGSWFWFSHNLLRPFGEALWAPLMYNITKSKLTLSYNKLHINIHTINHNWDSTEMMQSHLGKKCHVYMCTLKYRVIRDSTHVYY